MKPKILNKDTLEIDYYISNFNSSSDVIMTSFIIMECTETIRHLELAILN